MDMDPMNGEKKKMRKDFYQGRGQTIQERWRIQEGH